MPGHVRSAPDREQEEEPPSFQRGALLRRRSNRFFPRHSEWA
jgi:hypothetical protein